MRIKVKFSWDNWGLGFTTNTAQYRFSILLLPLTIDIQLKTPDTSEADLQKKLYSTPEERLLLIARKADKMPRVIGAAVQLQDCLWGKDYDGVQKHVQTILLKAVEIHRSIERLADPKIIIWNDDKIQELEETNDNSQITR